MAGKARIMINYDKIYNSNSCGKFKIIKDLGRDNRSRLYVRVKFIDTGTEVDLRYDLVMAGKVMDDLYGIDFNKTYNSLYYGFYKIMAFIGRDDESKKIVRIKFFNTGYETNVLLREAKSGMVKDITVPFKNRKLHFLNTDDYIDKLIKILKGRWCSMLQRCYKSSSIMYHDYGACGVTVCKRWHKFGNYLADMIYIPYFDKFVNDPLNYQLDKDYLQFNLPKSKRIYSPTTCIFLSIEDNANLAIKCNHNRYVYYGIKYFSNAYKVVFINKYTKERECFGTYSDLVAAINEYNYYYERFGCFELVPLYIENFPFIMSHEDAQSFLIK